MPHSSPFLTPYQRQTLFWFAVALGLGILLWALRPVLTPFLFGAIVAYILQPGVAWLERRRVPRGAGALLMMLFFALLITLLALLVLVVVQKEGPQVKQQVPGFFAHLHGWLQPKLAFLGLGDALDFATLRDLVTSRLEGSTQAVATAAWSSLRASSGVMISLVGGAVMVPLVLFYLLYDSGTG